MDAKIIRAYQALSREVLQQALHDARKQNVPNLESDLKRFINNDFLSVYCGLANTDEVQYRRELAKAYKKGVEDLKTRRLKNELLRKVLKGEKHEDTEHNQTQKFDEPAQYLPLSV